MSDIFDAEAHISRVFKDYSWPEQDKFFQTGLVVSPQRAEHLQLIEEALYQTVQAHYPDLYLDRTIRVTNFRSYEIEIRGNRKKQRYI